MELREELKKLVAAVIEVDEFADDENFVEDLGVDSMIALEILVELEKKFKIVIPASRISEMRSLNDITRMVSDKLDSK